MSPRLNQDATEIDIKIIKANFDMSLLNARIYNVHGPFLNQMIENSTSRSTSRLKREQEEAESNLEKVYSRRTGLPVEQLEACIINYNKTFVRPNK